MAWFIGSVEHTQSQCLITCSFITTGKCCYCRCTKKN